MNYKTKVRLKREAGWGILWALFVGLWIVLAREVGAGKAFAVILASIVITALIVYGVWLTMGD